jgi:DNA-binding beta-propeller fold protein YncE
VPQAEQAEGEQQQIQEMRLRGVQAENRSHDQQIKRQLESKGETELQIKRARLEVRRKQTVLVYVQRELFMAKRNLRNMEEQLQSNYPEAMADLMTRVVANLDAPYGITFNSSGKMIVSEWGINRVSILDENRQKIESFRADQMKSPAGIAIDNEDHIYVSSLNMLRKFTSSGELIKEFGQRGGVKGKLESPRGLAIHDKDKQLYVCDRYVHRIQVFDLDLNFVRSIGSRGKGKGEFDAPFDVTFDTAGNMYVAEFGNKRIQVMDTSGQFIRTFAEEEDGLPTGLYIVKDKVYISDFSHDSLLVYTTSGEYLATLASQGQAVGELSSPYCITSYDDKLYVCDSGNNRIHIFDL